MLGVARERRPWPTPWHRSRRRARRSRPSSSRPRRSPPREEPRQTRPRRRSWRPTPALIPRRAARAGAAAFEQAFSAIAARGDPLFDSAPSGGSSVAESSARVLITLWSVN